nr:hypothetical protein [Tanacetum cinerariifolium]
MDASFNNENEAWEYNLDIDDSDLHLTPAVRSTNSSHVKPSPYTINLVTIILGPSDPDGALMSTQQYMDKVVEDVGDDDDFKSAVWVSATNYVNTFDGTVIGCLGEVNNFLKNGKLELVVGIVKSCLPNMLGDLNVTMKDLSCTIPGTIHHKVIGKGGYGKDITVGAAMILTNVSIFSLTPSKHYLNITMRNVVERRGYQQMKEKNADMYEKLTRVIEDMRRVPEANTTPIIADQHFGVSDMSGFQSYQLIL